MLDVRGLRSKTVTKGLERELLLTQSATPVRPRRSSSLVSQFDQVNQLEEELSALYTGKAFYWGFRRSNFATRIYILAIHGRFYGEFYANSRTRVTGIYVKSTADST